VSSDDDWILEIRLFTVSPDARPEFHRISRDGTIPLMRQCGITVLAHGPSPTDDDGYFLIRAFPSVELRNELVPSVYATKEWEEKYEEPVMKMIQEYHTTLLPVSRRVIEEWSATG
jgi:hypothetical protein